MTATVDAVEGTERPLLDLDRLVAGIRWRRRLMGGLALVGVVLGVATATVLPSRATADASIYVVHEVEGSGDGQSLMKTDLALLETSTVAGDAIRRLGSTIPAELFMTTYSGTITADNILTVTARAADDAHALAAVQAVADAFIAVHVARSSDATAAEVKAYDDRRDQVQKDLDDVNRQIATAGVDPGAPQVQALYNRRSVLASQISDLQQQVATAAIGSPQVAAGTKIIDSPHRTSRSPVVSVALYGGIGLGLGFSLGFVLAAVAAVVRERPLLRRDIASHLGASVIAQVPAPLRGPRRLVRRSLGETERRRVSATLVRLIRADDRPVSLLEIGCVTVAVDLVRDIAQELGAEMPVRVVNDLPDGRKGASLTDVTGAVEIVPGAQFPPAGSSPAAPPVRQLAIAGVGPGTRWTDLARLAGEALLVVRAGSAEATWLHTVARQLADAEILVLGVVVVHPDPRDRTDGTLWDAVHTALRGRAERRPAGAPAAAPAASSEQTVVPISAVPGGLERPRPRPISRPAPNGGTPSRPPGVRPRVADGHAHGGGSVPADDGVAVGGAGNGHKPAPRPRIGRGPADLSCGADLPTAAIVVANGSDIQSTDKFQLVAPTTPVDHVEAT